MPVLSILSQVLLLLQAYENFGIVSIKTWTKIEIGNTMFNYEIDNEVSESFVQQLAKILLNSVASILDFVRLV